MIDVLKRHEIQVLRRAGHSLEEVVELAGVSQSSVQRVAAEPPVRTFDSLAERVRRGIGRPSKPRRSAHCSLPNWRGNPGCWGWSCCAGRGWRATRARCARADCGDPATQRAQPLVRFEGLPGGSRSTTSARSTSSSATAPRPVHFFASRLKYSRWAQVSLVDDERVEALVRSLVDHFAAMDGIPLLAVFDRPKTVALAWRRDGVVTSGIRPSPGWRSTWGWESRCAGPIARGRRVPSRIWSAG